MRRRSERKKSTEVLSPPPVVKRASRRSHRSTSQVETRKGNKTEDAKINNEVVNNETKQQSSSANEKTDDSNDAKPRCSVSPQVEEKKTPVVEQELETIAEVPADNNTANASATVGNDANATNHKDESPESEKTPENNVPVVAVTTDTAEQNSTDKSPVEKIPDASNDSPKEEDEIHSNNNNKEESPPPREEPVKCKDVEVASSEVNTHAKQATIEVEQDKTDSPEKTEKTDDSASAAPAAVEGKKTFTRSRERRAQQQVNKIKEEPENDENAEINSKSSQQKNSSFLSTPSNEKTQNTRKRRWLSKRSSDTNSQILAISTDSLKNLISDVHPVPLCDVKLESSSDVEEVESEREDGEASPTPYKPRTEKPSIFDRERKTSKNYDQPTRKISVLNDGFETAQPVPPRNASSCILYITNLVRPFTILQLKGLLARTGKIVENRFWIDKIKSKCYVQYETEDEAIETRHALHGVRWPTSNPKCLNVDFGTTADMEKAMASTQETGPQFGQETGRENRIVGTGWDRDRFEFDEKKVQVGRPVREWDVGKREELESEAERAREREKLRVGERGDRVSHSDRNDKEGIRSKERGDRERDRKRRSSENEHRRSLSSSPARKAKKKNNDPPLRLLDDLFRKTKTTPCIYWLPLTPEQIAEKEAFRLRRIAEHQERVKQRELEKEKEREKERDRERERDKERRRERERSIGHRRSCSRDRRRY